MSWGRIYFCVAGVFVLLAALLDWDFFMEHRKARFIVDTFGREGARVFYGLVGVVLIVVGVCTW